MLKSWNSSKDFTTADDSKQELIGIKSPSLLPDCKQNYIEVPASQPPEPLSRPLSNALLEAYYWKKKGY